jgi:ferric-dicitrate binding protein FerR (iron transport regulator)
MFIVVLAIALAVPTVALGQQGSMDPQGWDEVQRLALGTRVRVTFLDGSQLEGDLLEARSDALVLLRSTLTKGQVKTSRGSLQQAQEFLKSGIASVQVARAPRRRIRIGPLGWVGIGYAVFSGVVLLIFAIQGAPN